MLKRTTWVAALTLALTPALTLAGELPKNFTLGKYVPADCFLYVHSVHNPEADFIVEHWARVFDAVKQSGVGEEIKTLFVGNLTPEDRAEFDSFWATFTKLIGGVQWGDLVTREFVFAERFGGQGMPMPGLLFLSRPEPETMSSNVDGLKAVWETLASLSEEVSLTEEKLKGADVWSLSIAQVPLTLHLFQKGEVVGLVLFQRAILDDTLALMAGEASKSSIVDGQRFREALAAVPTPEDEVVYFDMRQMVDALSCCVDMFTAMGPQTTSTDSAAPQPPNEAMRAQQLFKKLLDECNIIEYAVTTTETKGLQQFGHSVHRMRADYQQKALGRILMNPKPIERFDRFIPVEATGFSIWSGIDWTELYHTILSTIKDFGPEGETLLQQWADAQKEIAFDLDEDVFSWLGSETVTVNLPPSAVSAFGASADWVTLIRVKDAPLATTKVNAAITRLNSFLKEKGQASLMITPATKVSAEGFQNVTHPFVMMFVRITVGVSGDWLVVGSSESAVSKVLATAEGKTKTIMDNPRFQKEGVVPTGPVVSASFTDLSNLGNELGGAMMMMSFVAGMMPNEPEVRPIKAVLASLGRLGPAFAELNFFSSKSSATTIDGLIGRAEVVTTYKPIKPKPPQVQPNPAAEPAAAGRAASPS